MATAIDLTAFKAYTISTDFSGIMANITNDQFVILLSQAIINKQMELKHDVSDAYFGTSSLTTTSGGFTASLPSDIDPDTTKNILIFNSDNRIPGSELDRSFWRRQGSTIRFSFSQSGKVYQLEYQKEPNQYDSTNMSQTVPETVNPRSKSYLAYEMLKIFFDGLRNGEASATGQNAQVNSNRIS